MGAEVPMSRRRLLRPALRADTAEALRQVDPLAAAEAGVP
jgi:hypothetical protein